MGDGGVACVTSQHVVERYSICNGNGTNGNGTNANASNNELSSNMNAQTTSKKKKKTKTIKKLIKKKKGESGLKSSVNSKDQDLGSNNHSSSSNINSGNRVVVSDPNKDEVEEGELGTLPELIVDDRWRKGEEDVDTAAPSESWRKDELEKGEFVPDRWRPKDDYSYSKGRRYESAKEKIWKGDRDWSSPPPPPPSSGKYLSEKELCRSANQVNKRGGILGRGPKMSSKFVDEEGHELNSGKNYARESFSGNRLKRAGFDGDKPEDYPSSKSRKLSANGARSMYSTDQQAQRSVYRNAPASSRQVSSDRYSSRHYDSSRMAQNRARHYDHRERSPGTGHHDHNRSPYDRSHQGDRSRSPYDRSRHFKRSPSYSEWSPSDQARYQRGGTPPDHSRPRELNRKSAFQKKQTGGGRRGAGEKPKQKDPNGRDMRTAVKSSADRINLEKGKFGVPVPDCNKQGPTGEAPDTIAKEVIQENGTAQELVSMEEDMDICNTPPHEPVVDAAISGKWFYLDQLGDEQGPSLLCDLKKLMEEGFIVSDHLVKHMDSDRWVTVEKAVSPVANANITILPDSSSALVTPPEAPGNLLVDTDDVVDPSCQVGQGIPSTSLDMSSCSKRSLAALEPGEDLNIDGRVGALLDGLTLIPGKELDLVGEMLNMMSVDGEWDRWRKIEGFTWPQVYLGDNHTQISDEMVVRSESTLKEASGLTLADEKDSAFDYEDVVAFSGQWPCKGGDWKRTDETAQDRTSRKKLVLNGGYPICQMPKSGLEDPRWQRKDELYYPSQSKKLDLPPWACSSVEDWNDNSIVNKMAQSKLSIARGMRGIMLPVVRINACVVNDPDPVPSDSQMKAKSKGKYSKSSRNYSVTGEPRRSSSEGLSRTKSTHEKDSQGIRKSNTPFSAPKDHVCTADELQLSLGEWFYVDGAGHERGPLSFSELQVLVDQGVIQNYSSAFRKVDKVWVPVTSASKTSDPTKMSEISGGNSNINSEKSLLDIAGAKHDDSNGVSSRFHTLHPQFIGYTRGKIHELVMKSYKSREFAAAINEVLDPWLNARQPKKEVEKQIYNSTLLQKSDQLRDGKKLHADDSEDEDEMEHAWTPLKDELPFDAICGNANFGGEEKRAHPELGNASWVQLDGSILARVFHFLRADVKTLVNVALTCKIWRSVLNRYKKASRQVDLSSIAPICNDAMLWNIMEGYNKENVCTLVLRGCSNITPHMLEEVLQSFLSMSSIDIRGCSQMEDLASKFTNIYWIKSRTVHSRRSMKLVTDKTSLASKLFSSLDAHADDSSGLRHYLESSERRDSANQVFQQSLYKRSKLYDTRQSSSILSRDAHLRRLAMRNSYKRMERLIASKLKDIMKENTFGIFVPKIAEIQNKMRNGYYAGRGLSSVKEDIIRMCRDAMKSKNRGDVRNINRIITLFIRLAKSLDGDADPSTERDVKLRRDGSPPGFSASAKKKKKVMEKRYMNRVMNDISESGDDASDREIKRHLSRLNKKPMDSGSETSDDPDRSSDGSLTDSESTASDSESDLDLKSEIGGGGSRREQYISPDDGLDSLADEREWGARMTKSGLVPPVTRKYEVIDEYVIVAEEEEVKRKMRVSLPEDYAEKLNAQRNGTEESETQIPTVKDYKPRKQLGNEVIEQEVYGIDPYTHNLILDSIKDVSDWPPLDKHIFIEDVLLRILNKQVRKFTGSGNTPMVYQLKPAFEEIMETAEEEHDLRTVRLCETILKVIDSRPEDNYVAYRKGLGVVCNKEGGFNEDDFVVEFLGEVYPAWKWHEKQDGIRALQKNSKDPAPEFYNILLERPKGDADGFDLLVVDAMHKANYASRICHSCRPNCEAKVTAVNGQYMIGIYTVRPIQYGEEVTFDYNSITESKEESEASVCLCGSEVCRGSYLNLVGEGAIEKVLKDFHGVLHRHQLMLEACELNSASEEDHIDLLRAGLGRCLLDGLPDWLIAYSARLVRFINFERVKLSKEILKHNLDEKKKYCAEISLDHEKREAEVQANGVFDHRLQDLAITLNKVRYVMRCVFGNPKTAPPPLQRLSAREMVSYLWTGEESLVKGLLECITPHVDDRTLKELKAKIHAHDPSNSDDIELGLKKSLIWLRDEVRDLPCSSKCRHDAAADLIHIYAHTKCFIKMREYKTVTSPPVYISPLDLCRKSADNLGTQGHEYCKTYGENYCLGQLIYWHNQDKADPDRTLARASRGCLSLPEIGSFYAKVQKPSRQRVYGPRTVKFMLSRMAKQPEKPWPKDRIWSFTDTPKVVGSPMLDAVLNNASLDKDMVHWLKNRLPIFHAMGDR